MHTVRGPMVSHCSQGFIFFLSRVMVNLSSEYGFVVDKTIKHMLTTIFHYYL